MLLVCFVLFLVLCVVLLFLCRLLIVAWDFCYVYGLLLLMLRITGGFGGILLINWCLLVDFDVGCIGLSLFAVGVVLLLWLWLHLLAVIWDRLLMVVVFFCCLITWLLWVGFVLRFVVVCHIGWVFANVDLFVVMVFMCCVVLVICWVVYWLWFEYWLLKFLDLIVGMLFCWCFGFNCLVACFGLAV